MRGMEVQNISSDELRRFLLAAGRAAASHVIRAHLGVVRVAVAAATARLTANARHWHDLGCRPAAGLPLTSMS